MGTQAIVLLGLAALCLASALLGTYFMLRKEYSRYRELVPNAKALLSFGSSFWLEEHLDQRYTRVQLKNTFFEDPYVYRAVLKDLSLLQKRGVLITESFFSSQHIEIPAEVIQKRLPQYRKLMVSWQDENQGRPNLNNLPKPPYSFSVTALESKVSE